MSYGLVHFIKQKSKYISEQMRTVSRKRYVVGYLENTKGYRILYKENNEVSLSQDVIFNDNFVDEKCVEYSKNINNNNNINVHKANKDNVFKHEDDDKLEENKIMENQLKPNNEGQQVEQKNGTNVNTYNLRGRSKINKPIRYNNSSMFVVEYKPENFKNAVVTKFRKMD